MLELPEDQEEIDGYLTEGHRLLADKEVANIPFTTSVRYPSISSWSSGSSSIFSVGKVRAEVFWMRCLSFPFTMSTNLQTAHPMIDYTLAAVKEAAKTEAAVLNSGLFLTDIPAGIVNQSLSQEN
jgi:hypothetical protein